MGFNNNCIFSKGITCGALIVMLLSYFGIGDMTMFLKTSLATEKTLIIQN